MKIANITKKSSVWQGEKYIIWTQGCNKSCKNCIAPEWQNINGGKNIPVNEIIKDILSVKNIDGVVISGGEPFLQEKELIVLTKKIKEYINLSIILYTGYNYKEIQNNKVLNYIDLLITGEYIENLNNDRGIAGSANQEYIFLTNKLIKNKEIYKTGERILEFNINDNSITMVGIPPKDF